MKKHTLLLPTNYMHTGKTVRMYLSDTHLFMTCPLCIANAILQIAHSVDLNRF